MSLPLGDARNLSDARRNLMRGNSKTFDSDHSSSSSSSSSSDSSMNVVNSHATPSSRNSGNNSSNRCGSTTATGSSSDWVITNYDRETCHAPNIEVELKRLQVLKTFDLLNDPHQNVQRQQQLAEGTPAWNVASSSSQQPGANASHSYYYLDCCQRITLLASQMLGAPMAMVNLVDLGRTYSVASMGLPPILPTSLGWTDHRNTPRQSSPCAHTILLKRQRTSPVQHNDSFSNRATRTHQLPLLVVPDLIEDTRFCDNAYLAALQARFYAACPLMAIEGVFLGTLCILDTKPRPQGLSLEESSMLCSLSHLVMDYLEQRRLFLLRPAIPSPPLPQAASDVVNTTASNNSSTTTRDVTAVQTTVSFLRENLQALVHDTGLQCRLTPRHKRTLTQAYDGADYLYQALVDDPTSPTRSTTTTAVTAPTTMMMDTDEVRTRRERSLHHTATGWTKVGVGVRPIHAMGTLSSPAKTTPGSTTAQTLNIMVLVASLYSLVESVKNVRLSFDVHPAVPPSIVANDLKVFRSLVAIISGVCEQLQDEKQQELQATHSSSEEQQQQHHRPILSHRPLIRINIKLDTAPIESTTSASSSQAPSQPSSASAGFRKMVLFECESSGPSNLFDSQSCKSSGDAFDASMVLSCPPNSSPGNSDRSNCIQVDAVTGALSKPTFCCNSRISSFSTTCAGLDGALAMQVVSQYVKDMNGITGVRPRCAVPTATDPGTGSITWFSIPLITAPES